ncbi:heavy metal-binding protein HIP-like [Mytilus edulis]|uniref:heavy metal-binding protein HIP-like n=1 Tax=Mytilus edulis TaxID=6550 RepID=UPI0039EFFF81
MSLFTVALLSLFFYFCSVTNADLDTESRIVLLEKIMHDRMADLEKIVHEQKDEIQQLRQEVTLLRSQVGQTSRQTKIPTQVSSRTKLTDDDVDDDVPLKHFHVEHSIHQIKKDKRLLVNNIVSNRIAFYAYMKKNEPIQQHKTLIFDVIKTNFGNGYNNNTGAFTAPSSGVYVLTFTVHPGSSGSFASVNIVVNNEQEGAIYTDSNEGTFDLNAATAVVVVWMNQGDVSFVRTSTTDPPSGSLRSDDGGRCSFAGWKISE